MLSLAKFYNYVHNCFFLKKKNFFHQPVFIKKRDKVEGVNNTLS
jgi:hypothetical protein